MTDSVEKKTFSAKQVATRIGTDAKQLRKFLRDPNSGYTPVGQGGRYDFPEADLVKIKEAFDAWDATKVRRNRTSPEKKLATAAGLIPGQRKTSPGTDAPPRSRRAPRPEQLFKQGLHGNALDNDTLSERHAGIKARVEKHGLMPNQQGRLVEMPEHIRRAKETGPITYPDLSTIPGLDKPLPVELDFSETISDGKEAELDKMYSDIFDIPAEDDEELDWEEVED